MTYLRAENYSVNKLGQILVQDPCHYITLPPLKAQLFPRIKTAAPRLVTIHLNVVFLLK